MNARYLPFVNHVLVDWLPNFDTLIFKSFFDFIEKGDFVSIGKH